MSKENIIVTRREADGSFVQVLRDGSTRPLTDKTDWQRLREMTEDEVQAAALADPDAQPVSGATLKWMKRVPRVKTLRRALRLSEREFSRGYHLPINTLRDWEKGRREPDEAAQIYLTLIATDPQGVRHALERPQAVQQIANYETEHISRIQRRVADIAITIGAIRKIGFNKALPVARDFVASLDLREFSMVRDEAEFIHLLDQKTDELQKRFLRCRALQKKIGSEEAELWGSARKVLNVFLCEAYFNRVLESYYNLRTVAFWLEIPLDSQLVEAIQKKADVFGFDPPPRFTSVKRLNRETSKAYQRLAGEITERLQLPARIYFEVDTWETTLLVNPTA